MDFSNAFVQAKIDSKIYIEVPSMFESEGDRVIELNKSLYGILKAPLLWYNHMKKGFKKSGFVQSNVDPCLFYADGVVAVCYVDDCLFFGKDQGKIDAAIGSFKSNGYTLTEEEYVFAFLGVEVNTDESTGKVTLPKKGLMQKIKIYCGMENYNYKFTPAGLAPLSHDIHGIPFEEDWEYKTKVFYRYTIFGTSV